MFEFKKLCCAEIERCENIISSNTFYMIVGDALLSKKRLSVVRMGDGERHLLNRCNGFEKYIVTVNDHPDLGWLEELGVLGIPKGLLKSRLYIAAEECTYFAPSISGIWRSDYFTNDLSSRERYVDNFFVNAWTEEMKIQLFKQAGHVLLIHANTHTADAMQIRSTFGLGVKVSYIKLTDWRGTEQAIREAYEIDAPLVLYSAGPAGKYIGPTIANYGCPKVVIDLGHAADHWTFDSLKEHKEVLNYIGRCKLERRVNDLNIYTDK